MQPGKLKELRDLVIANHTVPEFHNACQCCKRGAVELPVPDLQDLEALHRMIEGFDMYRRRFTPEIQVQIDRAKYALGYLNSLHAGNMRHT